MDFCPHCGEPLNPAAETCPHCGSDIETGWDPDADSYIELPDDSEFSPHLEREVRVPLPWDRVMGYTLVALAGVFFVLASDALIDRTAMLIAIGLAVCLWVFLVATKKRSA